MGPVKPNIVAPESTETVKPNVVTPTTSAMDYNSGPFAAPNKNLLKRISLKIMLTCIGKSKQQLNL